MQYQGTPTTSHTCAVHELAPHASRCRGRTTTVRFFPPCAETATATESHRARARIPRVASFPREVPDDTLGVGTCRTDAEESTVVVPARDLRAGDVVAEAGAAREGGER